MARRVWSRHKLSDRDGVPGRGVMVGNGMKSVGLVMVLLLGAAVLMGQSSLPKGPTWEKKEIRPPESKLPDKSAVPLNAPATATALMEARRFGTVMNQHTLKSALSAIGSNQATLHLSPGNWVIDENLDFPKNITLRFERGAIFSVGSGVKVTINSEIEAGFQQIFSGQGSIEGNIMARFIYPQWWGAQGDGVADDYEAIAKAAQAATGKVLFFRHGTYLTSQMIVLPEQIFLDADPGTSIKAGNSMKAVMTADVALSPNYGAQQFSIKNLRIDGNKLANNCIYLYKISMNNFPALDGISAYKAD